MTNYQNLRFGYERIAEYYDIFAENADIPFYLDMAKIHGSPILDLAAGTGRVAIPLVRAGHSVVALEKSPAMLSILRARQKMLPKSLRKRLTIVEGDMTDFSLAKEFPLIIIPLSFGHAMTTEEQLSLLRCVYNHLTADGIFVLDLLPGGAMPEHAIFENPPKKMPDGRMISRRGTINCNYTEQILTLHLVYTIFSDNNEKTDLEIIESISGAAIIFNREADLLIQMSGLKIVAEFGWFDGRPYTPECGLRILLLQKG